jgi:ABC-type amino acid transport substrate-binding protein
LAALNQGYVDIVVSGQQMTSAKLAEALFTTPVLDLTQGVVVADYRVSEFDTLEKVRKHAPFTVAFTNEFQGFQHAIKKYPNIKFVFLNNTRDFFEQDKAQYDVLLTSLEAGMAWSLLYPDFKAFKYKNVKKFPVSYVVARENQALLVFLNSWLELEKTVGTVDRLFKYWVEGENAVPEKRRWSIARDILGWVDE